MDNFRSLSFFIFMTDLRLIRLLNLPLFEDAAGFAKESNFDEKSISRLTIRNNRFYKETRIPKKSGGYRTIHQPNRELKAMQAWILRNILQLLEPSEYATAFRKGAGIAQNVYPHSTNRFFMSVDVENFFPSIKSDKVFNIFKTIGYNPTASWLLTRICTYEDAIPQGAVTSPHISNLICSRLDRRLGGLTKKRNIIFTRYCDDMTFSARNPYTLMKSFKIVKKIIESEGFNLNHQKTRFTGPYRQTRITGLIKNASFPNFNVGRTKRRLLRSMIFNFCFKNRHNLISEDTVWGHLNFIKSINETTYLDLVNYFKKLEQKKKLQAKSDFDDF